MKLKVIASVILAAAVGSNAYALQITKGKLVKHKEWTTGSATLKILPNKLTKKDAMKRLSKLQKVDEGYTVINSEVDSANALVGQPATVVNSEFVAITNNSDVVQSYWVTSDVCVELHNNMTECVFMQDTYELEPGGTMFDTRTPVLSLTFAEPGKYAVYASSDVDGDNGSINLYSRSGGTITVS